MKKWKNEKMKKWKNKKFKNEKIEEKIKIKIRIVKNKEQKSKIK